MTTRALVPLAQGCEELEAVTIIDLLRRAGIEVVSAGLDDEPVVASRGVRIVPDTSLTKILDQRFDLIVLPGGLPGADHLNSDSRIHRLLQKQAEEGRYCAAICAAPKVLASAGLLNGKRATAYPGTLETNEGNRIQYVEQDVVVDGKIITSRGPGTAMDFALEIIERLLGKNKRLETETPLLRSYG
jgi:4-methyl-5(b-hydroxyethyl)-thiazole monophosphate biosynthesis